MNQQNNASTVRFGASIFFSFSLVCLAGAIIYFANAALRVITELPAVVSVVEQSVINAQPAFESIALATEQLPHIVLEISEIRKQIPLIIQESEALRSELPAILKRVDSIEAQVSPILNEVEQVRQTIPSIVNEMEGYRLLMPSVLKEVEATRDMIPVTMDRAEVLISQASVAGQQASEGAVTGFFSGVVKAPFALLGGMGSSMSGALSSQNPNVTYISDAAHQVIQQGELNSAITWHNKKTDDRGEVVLLELNQQAGKDCRKIMIKISPKKESETIQKLHVCLNKDGQWEEQVN